MPGGRGAVRGRRAAIPRPGRTQELVTQNLLIAADESYPADIKARYTDVPEGAIGTDAARAAGDRSSRWRESRRTRTDLAVTMEAYLQSDDELHLRHRTSPTTRATAASQVECFARDQARLLPPLRLDDGDPAAGR